MTTLTSFIAKKAVQDKLRQWYPFGDDPVTEGAQPRKAETKPEKPSVKETPATQPAAKPAPEATSKSDAKADPEPAAAPAAENAPAKKRPKFPVPISLSGPSRLVIAGPSGVGKGTLIEKLKAEHPDVFEFGVSHTTRAPRQGEQDGVHYHFVTREQFQDDVDSGLFVEHAEVHGNLYGTSTEAVESVSEKDKICILDIDVQGCRSVREMQIPAVFVFIEPPSMEALEQRLQGRGAEPDDIARRLEDAKAEMAAKDEEGLFDHVIMNEDVEAAYATLKGSIQAEVTEVVERHSKTRPMSSENKPVVVFVLGGPGAGKGTQCANLVRDYGWVHLSAGDLLRAEQETESEDAALIKDFIKEGKIVPVEITIRLLVKAMERSETKRFLIDGFPRSLDNRDGWEREVGDKAQVAFCLNFECTEEELEKRLLKRGETSGRADDNIESIKKRFVAFTEQTKPVLEAFRERDLLRTVQAAQPMEDVWNETKALFVGVFPSH